MVFAVWRELVGWITAEVSDVWLVQQGLNPLTLVSSKPSGSYREFIKNEPRFRGLLREMDDGGGEVQTFCEDELRKRYDLYEQMAGSSGSGIKADAKKPADV